MININIIYLSLIIIITLWSLYLYLESDKDYKNELQRIQTIENNIRKKKEALNYYRVNSIPCNVPNLNDPRSCYMSSNYNCKWSELSDRCNQID